MKVYLASDHAGFALKEIIKAYLIGKGYEVEDCGAFILDKDDDYPDYIAKAAQAVIKDQNSKAIIFGSSGQGEAITANKFKNIRAVVFYALPFEMARITRLHNDANILSIGAKFLSEDDAKKAVDLWLNTPFSNEERHKRRIDKIDKIESKYV
jgi:ribose 5-phosphate isomerase B